ncbi:hypothetical protein HK107_08045 [Parvularcula sp. ZS-1/3]|uniref:Uncharacterized protein n=1 Tax=Parvularcula mediterranea TaxID=2732508 RepID=A0A7Y3RLN3_9PROT|nr:hypothetical protein [Parvularcula mediterranea]NNU16270.1 hypothetical protein [Parvularcula mediterranea]
MIRVFLPLVLALVAYAGPWTGAGEGQVYGYDLAETTKDCFLDLNPSFTGECAPTGSLRDRLVTYTVIGGAIAAVLSVFGLLPLIGRLTSLVVLIVGAAGAVAAVLTLLESSAQLMGWGAWGSLAAGVACIAGGLDGLRGGRD